MKIPRQIKQVNQMTKKRAETVQLRMADWHGPLIITSKQLMTSAPGAQILK